MCGRFAIAVRAEEMQEVFGVAGAAVILPRFNVGPEQHIAVIRLEHGERRLALLFWGFPVRLPGAPSPKLVINARGETVDNKPSFREAFRSRRCLIPASGFYEWQAQARGPKQPFYAKPRSGKPFAMAGIWERITLPDGKTIEAAAIVTCEANAFLRPIHERMPVILAPSDWEVWLAGSPAAAKALIRPAPDDFFEAYAVSTAVNRVANDTPELILPQESVLMSHNAPRLI
jgi:putative SOS response-associated peptidase YedK